MKAIMIVLLIFILAGCASQPMGPLTDNRPIKPGCPRGYKQMCEVKIGATYCSCISNREFDIWRDEFDRWYEDSNY